MAMDRFKNFLGIMSDIFQIGGPDGKKIKNNTSSIDLRNAADDAFVTGRAAHIAAGATIDDIATLLNLRARAADIEFSFDGASAPAGGANTGKLGICHTTGGSYTAGDVVYDNGTALLLMPTEVCRMLTTRTAVGGTLNLVANSVYVLEGSTWVNKSADSGGVKVIEVPYDFEDGTVSSTATIPTGARIIGVSNVVETAFDVNNATLKVEVDGATTDLEIMATNENRQKKAAQYDVDEVFKVTDGGPVKLTVVPGAATEGAGVVYVRYTSAPQP